MLLYLVRHGHAVTLEEDPARPLSLRGVADTKRVAEFFKNNGAFAPSLIWHSPLARARQTASILASELKLDAALIETSDILPEDNPEDLLPRLDAAVDEHSIAVVGHEPYLSTLATLLVRGKDRPSAVEFKKGAVLALERGAGTHKRTGHSRWVVVWHITPALLLPEAAQPVEED